MAVQQYIGARYVPKMDGAWNSDQEYEPLTTVSYLNATYTSKKSVPAGVVPTNEEYWMRTSFESGQTAALETWRAQVVDPFIAESGEKFTQIDDTFTDINTEFAAVNENITDINSDIQQIDANFAPSEDGNTSGHNYAVNDYILWKGDLYKVISAIVSGDTFTVDGNIEKTSFDNAIKDLLNKVNDLYITLKATGSGTTFGQQLNSFASHISAMFSLSLNKKKNIMIYSGGMMFRCSVVTSNHVRFECVQLSGATSNTLIDTLLISENSSAFIRKTITENGVQYQDMTNTSTSSTMQLYY